ncbi:Ig-like domain-containing protein [Brevibacillus gelatini]|uniref:Ig-like domain-containing protein n=1 Tax=Brevibacillus gelatini TaxID=1655277 RepID=UPI003D81788C
MARITTPVTVVNQPYDTSGNGGRKLVRLSNGWFVAAIRNTSDLKVYFFKSLDNGQTWQRIGWTYAGVTDVGNFAIACKDTIVYLVQFSGTAGDFYKFDAATQTDSEISRVAFIESGQNDIGPGVSLAINEAGTELHAAWASKNSNYPNSFNIRYAKGIVDENGNVTWGSVTQVTANGGTNIHAQNPCIVVRNDKPFIFCENSASSRRIMVFTTTFTTQELTGSAFPVNGFGNKTVYVVTTYPQSSPCAVVDNDGVIHVVWHGKDSTQNIENIRYSKSIDGGVTWATMEKLTSESTFAQYGATITVDSKNRLYVFFAGGTTSGLPENIRRIIYDGSWGSIEKITNNTTAGAHAHYPSVMEKEHNSLIGWIYRDTQASAVKFDSIILNQSPTITLTNPSDNQTLAEVHPLQLEGSATDSDNGNVVTIKYKINNSTPRALQSGVSNGSTPISFAKSLTYSNKRLWDGSTDVTGVDLAENTDHTLTVWAEDDKGGKSVEVARKFRVIWNRPPTISGENGNLGTITERPTITYSATDPEGNTFTFTEYLNGQQVRSFTGEAGQEYTFQLTHDAWIRLDLDVPHQAKIVATDSAGMSSERVYTFTRTETHIEFMLDYDNPDVQAFFTVDGMPNRILVTLERYLPPGSSIESVRVTNNYLDAQPTWEDATGAVIGGRGYLFTNTTKTADDWAVCVWVTIAKGSADQRVHVYGYGGAFD